MWEEAKDQHAFQITEDDASMLAQEITLPTNQVVLEAMSDGDFPSLADAKEFLSSRSDLFFGTKVRHNTSISDHDSA